jgi:5-enolpyruvylshikimate-3-phosphate synthase
VEENSEDTRRAIQGDQLLSASELERSKSQLAIAQDNRHREEWNAARLARFNSRTTIRNVRAAIMTVNFTVVSAWVLAYLIAGEASAISPVDLWHLLTSLW